MLLFRRDGEYDKNIFFYNSFFKIQNGHLFLSIFRNLKRMFTKKNRVFLVFYFPSSKLQTLCIKMT